PCQASRRAFAKRNHRTFSVPPSSVYWGGAGHARAPRSARVPFIVPRALAPRAEPSSPYGRRTHLDGLKDRRHRRTPNGPMISQSVPRAAARGLGNTKAGCPLDTRPLKNSHMDGVSWPRVIEFVPQPLHIRFCHRGLHGSFP